MFYGIEQGLQTTEELYDAVELPVDLDVLHPRRTLTHDTAISYPGASTGPEQYTYLGLGVYFPVQ